jgi:hypothetical protein
LGAISQDTDLVGQREDSEVLLCHKANIVIYFSNITAVKQDKTKNCTSSTINRRRIWLKDM